jgi:hypothetical protein
VAPMIAHDSLCREKCVVVESLEVGATLPQSRDCVSRIAK